MGDAVGSVLGSGPKIISAFMEKDAAKDAYRTQRAGLAKQQKMLKEDYNPERINAMVNKYDKKYLLKRVELQKEIDPELAELRQLGKEQLVAEFKTPTSARQSTQAANQLFRENINESPEAKKLRERLVTEANTELDQGAELPPEFQAELVRSGLEAGASSGIGLSRRTIGGNVSKILGSGGIALKNARQNQAMNLANTASGLTDARFKILSNIFPTVAAQEQQAGSRSAAAFAFGDASLPQGGLTGREVSSMDIAGREGQRNLVQQRADLSAQNKLTQARFVSNIIGQAASVGGLLYNPGTVDPATGAPAGGDGGGGSGGGMLGGLTGGGGGGSGGSIGSILGLVGMLSDKNVKENIKPLDEESREKILRKVMELPVSSWNYTEAAGDHNDGALHIGPMAQDFSEAFKLGSTDRAINVVDANGIMLTALQALAAKVLALENANP
jgi:hypothetical protein